MDRIISIADLREEPLTGFHAPSVEFKPNAETLAAFAEIQRGEGKCCNSIAELLAELDAED